MNRRTYFLIIPLLLIVLFGVGPRVNLDITLRPVELPADLPAGLDSYLAAEEAQFADLKADTEKTIIWANPTQKSTTAVAIVSIHGFSATRHETAPLGDRVAAQLGGNLFYTRLTGHGRSDDAMAEATVDAWLNDAMEAVAIGEALGDEVVLIGASTGASLITWLAATDKLSDKVAAIVFLSPNFGPANNMAEMLLLPWGEQIARLVEGPYRSWKPLNEQHAFFWTHRYPVGALLPMMGAVKLARDADLSKVHQPLLILHSAEDIVVNPEKTAYYFDQFGSTPKERIVVKTDHPWGHVLAGDILSPNTTEPLAQTIVDWLIPVLDAPEQ